MRAAANPFLTRTGRGLIKLIGPPLFAWSGRTYPLPAKAFAIIALLTNEPGGSLPRQRVRDCLWGDFPQEKANANLRQTLARVRKIEQDIGTSILIIDSDSIAFNAESFDIDLADALAVNVQQLIENRDLVRLEEFVEVISGEFLFGIEVADHRFESWQAEVRDRLEVAATFAISALIVAKAGENQLEARQRLARKLLRIDPTRELAYRTLMETYDAQGERALALQTYERCCEVLWKELRTEPESDTRRLAASLGFVDFGRFKLQVTPQSGECGDAGAGLGNKLDDGRAAGTPRIVLFPPLVIGKTRGIAKLAGALVEDVIIGLTRCRSFTVVAPHTSGQMAPGGIGPERTEQCPKVRYAVNTTIKPSSPEWAATFRLTNSETSAVLWATELKFGLDQLPLLFSRLSHQVIYSLADAIERAEMRFPFAASNSTAYRLYLEGRSAMSSSDLPDLRRARGWYRKSLEEFGSYAPAIAGLSRTMSMERLVRGLTDDMLLKEALALGKLAADLDPFDGRGLRECAFSYLYLKRHDECLYDFERAVALNPNDADLLADYADALAHAGQPERGHEMCLKAMDLNPLGPDYYHWILGSIYYQRGDYESAITALRPVQHHAATARLLAASCAMAGKKTEARHYAAVVLDTYPSFDPNDLFRIVPDKHPSDTQHLIEGLRLAGVQ